MSHRVFGVVVSLLLATVVAAQNPSPASSAPKQAGDFQTVYLVNTNADGGVFDNLTVRVQEWGRWKIVRQPEQADLLLVLSEKRETIWMPDPMPMFLSIPYYRWPTSMEVDMLTLVAVDRASNREVVTVSCARHHWPSAPKWLLSRLGKKIAEREKSDE